MTDSLTPVQRTRFDFIERAISKNVKETVDYLYEARDNRLYREKHKTMEEWTQSAFGWTSRRLEQVLSFEDMKKSGVPVENERQARALKGFPTEEAKKIVEEIKASGAEVTAAAIAKNANHGSHSVKDKNHAKDEPEPPKPEDCTGYIIPDQWVPLFNRTNEVKMLRSKVSDVRCELRKAQDNGDLLYASMSVSMVMSELDAAYKGLEDAIPHAVCPYCQGQSASHCKVCKGRGMVSKRIYNDVADKDLIVVREKAIAQRKEKAK